MKPAQKQAALRRSIEARVYRIARKLGTRENAEKYFAQIKDTPLKWSLKQAVDRRLNA